jgi:hypothetical protein
VPSAVALAFEVVLPRRGEVTTRDLRAVCGADLQRLEYVDIVVLEADGGMPVAARIELADVRSGWSRRRAFVCPTCRKGRHLLLGRGGKLQCSTCHQFRTRRQTERTCDDFTKRGGRQEDQLLRLLSPRWRGTTSVRLVKARRLVGALLETDRARVALLREQLEALRMAVETQL